MCIRDRHILWDDITVPRMILEHKLPTVLTSDEIDRLLDAIDAVSYTHLELDDISAMIPPMINNGSAI